MPKRTKKSPAGKSVAAILLLMTLGAGVLAAYVKLSPQAAHVASDRRGGDLEVTVQSKPDHTTKTITAPAPEYYVPAILNNDISLSKPAGSPPDGVRPEVYLVNQTLASLQIDGARAVGVDVQNHIAMMDFNPGIQKGYGSIEEGYLIKALQMALGQFPDINKFQVVVEGKTIDSLGNIDLSAPIDVIRPGAASASGNSDSN